MDLDELQKELRSLGLKHTAGTLTAEETIRWGEVRHLLLNAPAEPMKPGVDAAKPAK